MRDAFISGIKSRDIRQRLFENSSLTMDKAFEEARALATAHKNAESRAEPQHNPSTILFVIIIRTIKVI